MTSHAQAPGWEHQALDSIKSALGDSDPKLAALLAMFGRLASSEEMPGHEKIRSALRHPPHRRRRARTPHRRLGPPQAAVLIWLLASVAVITVAAILSHGGPPSCPQAWGICGGLGSQVTGSGGRPACGGSGRRPGAAARRRKRPLRLAWAISGGLAAALKLARATRLVTRPVGAPRPVRAHAASCPRPASAQATGRSIAQARCRRAALHSSIQAATLARSRTA